MSDLISREALGVGRCNPDVMLDPAYAAGWNGLMNIINNAPAVDAAPVVHGKWISNSSLNKCSECRTLWDTKTNFCPHCGAKMDGKEDGADHE